jgi:hypothetical protein
VTAGSFAALSVLLLVEPMSQVAMRKIARRTHCFACSDDVKPWHLGSGRTQNAAKDLTATRAGVERRHPPICRQTGVAGMMCLPSSFGK